MKDGFIMYLICHTTQSNKDEIDNKFVYSANAVDKNAIYSEIIAFKTLSKHLPYTLELVSSSTFHPFNIRRE